MYLNTQIRKSLWRYQAQEEWDIMKITFFGQRNDEFIIYKFGSDQIKVYRTEIEMEQDLNALGQYIELKPFDAY